MTGGLGSDTFNVNGPTPDVVSNDLLGHSGLIEHLIESDADGSEYAGLKVIGISANVGDDDCGAFFRHGFAVGATQTAAAACYDRDFIFQLHGVLPA